MAYDNNNRMKPTRRLRIKGCLLGGAVGDALGAPVEFLNMAAIRRHYGDAGIVRMENAYGRHGAITDDTQMMLFTAEGLILATVRDAYGENSTTAIYHAYLRWLLTQEGDRQGQLINTHGTCAVVDGILTGHRELFSRRAPGNSCLSALSDGRMGTVQAPINNSKGCGGVMRVAPVGLRFEDVEKAFAVGCASAAITHGHPTGYLAAGYLAALIALILSGTSLPSAIDGAIRILKDHPDHEECHRAIMDGMNRADGKPISPEVITSLGGGWVAEEALAISLCCALAAGDDFARGVLLAVNHDGDSDSTGAITGNILGALYGFEAIPVPWLDELELAALITEVAEDLADLA